MNSTKIAVVIYVVHLPITIQFTLHYHHMCGTNNVSPHVSTSHIERKQKERLFSYKKRVYNKSNNFIIMHHNIYK